MMEQNTEPAAPVAPPTKNSSPSDQKEVLNYFLEYMKLMKAGVLPASNSSSAQWGGNSQQTENYDNTSGNYGNQSGNYGNQSSNYCDASGSMMYGNHGNNYGIAAVPNDTQAIGNNTVGILDKQKITGEEDETNLHIKGDVKVKKSQPVVKERKIPDPVESCKKRRGGYRMYSLAFKLAAVNYANEHSRMAASKNFNVKYELIRMWCTQKGKLLESASQPNGRSRTRVCNVRGKPKHSAQSTDWLDADASMIGTSAQVNNSQVAAELSTSSQGKLGNPGTFLESMQASLQDHLAGTSQNLSNSASTDDKIQKPRKQCSYSIKFKLEVIEYFEKTGNKSATSRKFGVDTKRVRDWHRDKDKLKRRLQEHFKQVPWEKEPVRLAGSGRKIISPSLEIRIVSWIQELQRLNVRMSGQMICDQALEYYQADENIQRELEATNFDGFSASSGWLRSFLRRQNISLNHVLREEDVPKEAQQFIIQDANCSDGRSEPVTEQSVADQASHNTLGHFSADITMDQYSASHPEHNQC